MGNDQPNFGRGLLSSVGFCVDGQPFVIATLYGRDEEKLYMHGSAASRMLGTLETGIPACVTVTLVDGLVLSRSAFDHSMSFQCSSTVRSQVTAWAPVRGPSSTF